jgi:hypothetical protein
MLKALHVKARSKNLNPIVWNGFIENLERHEKYNLIFIPSGSFCLIIDEERVVSTLKKIYGHLSNKGVFVFEAETLKALPILNIWRGSVWHKPDGQTILLNSLTTLKDSCCYSIDKYELIDNNNVIHTEVEESTTRLYEPKILAETLKEAGFKDIRIIKAFNNTITPSGDDETIVYECRK